MAPCPVGSNLNNETLECKCNEDSYEGLTKCNDNSLTTYIEEGFWAGYLSNQTNNSVTTAICPVEFCTYSGSKASTDILLPQTSSNLELDAFICGPHRTGVLCGDCAPTYTVHYHSPYLKCHKDNNALCDIGWLLYILSELVPGKLKPVLDSFQGVFKDNLRFFAGLYFLYRWVGLLAYAISPSLNEFYAILQLLLLIILMIHAVAHPYEKRWHNILGFNYYYTCVTATKIRNKHTTDGVASFQLSLIYIVKAWKKYRSWKTRKNSFEFTPIEDFPARVINEDTNGGQEEEDEHAFLSPGIPAYIHPAYGGT